MGWGTLSTAGVTPGFPQIRNSSFSDWLPVSNVPDMDAHHEALAASAGLITTAQAEQLGYSRAEVVRLRAAGEMAGLRRGIYLNGPLPEETSNRHLTAAAAALLAVEGDDAVLAHRTAAIAWGFDWLRAPDLASVWLAQPRGLHAVRKYPGLHIWPATLPAHHLTHTATGLPVTSVARTVVDLARHYTFRESMVLAESALRRKLTTVDELHRIAADCVGWPYSRRVARVLAHADGTTESVAESLARAIFVEVGLPKPRTQVLIGDDGVKLARLDFLFGTWVAVPVDGREKYEKNPDERWREKRQEDRLREIGHEVVRLIWADLIGPPEDIRRRILDAMARADARHR